MNTFNAAILKELFKPAIEKAAPLIHAFQQTLAIILICTAGIIVLLLLIDWLIQRRKTKNKKQELPAVTQPVSLPEISTAAGTGKISDTVEVEKEEIKTEVPDVTVEPPVIPDPEIQLEEKLEWFSPGKNAEELSREFKLLCREKNISFVTELDDRLPEKIYGQRSRLNDLLEQLFTNALEQTDKGTITLKLKMVKANETSCAIQFLVTDSGSGIPSPLIAAIQSKNFSYHSEDEKLQATLTRLHAVKWAVEKQDGRLTLASKAGEGTTIGILLEFGI